MNRVPGLESCDLEIIIRLRAHVAVANKTACHGRWQHWRAQRNDSRVCRIGAVAAIVCCAGRANGCRSSRQASCSWKFLCKLSLVWVVFPRGSLLCPNQPNRMRFVFDTRIFALSNSKSTIAGTTPERGHAPDAGTPAIEKASGTFPRLPHHQP